MRTPFLRLLAGSFSFLIRARSATLTADRALNIDGDWTAGQIPQIDPGDATRLRWVAMPGGGGGSVTSFAVGTNANTAFSVATPTTTPVLSFASQTQRTVLAAPTGANGDPTFRALDAADIGSGTFAIGRIPTGTTGTTVALGNDSRFHSQNTDAGTTGSTFYLGGASGPRFKANGTALEARNAADTDFAGFTVNAFSARGAANFGATTITLNSEFVGASPTDNVGVTVNRSTGANGNAVLLWNESLGWWTAGTVGAGLRRIVRTLKQSFTAASLTSGILTVTHNFNEQHVDVVVYDNNQNMVMPGITATSANLVTLDFDTITITGSWTVVIRG